MDTRLPTTADPAAADRALAGEALPLCLRAIPDPPRRLFCRGNPAAVAAPSVAVVGARRCTRQGSELAFALARDLAAQGVCIVSGLAYGIDAAAHRGALAAVADHGAGATVAVLAGGLGHIYPAGHRRLAAEIVAAGGALVTEHSADVAPRRHHFPARNRIVSGLCLGVVIVEASVRSGSLITARLAAEQGRDVMAVPSAVSSPLSGGCHRLIRDGAALVECAAHVLEAVGLPSAPPAPAVQDEDDVLAQVAATVTSLEAIVAGAGLPVATVLERLLQHEMEGRIAKHGGGYVRARR